MLGKKQIKKFLIEYEVYFIILLFIFFIIYFFSINTKISNTNIDYIYSLSIPEIAHFEQKQVLIDNKDEINKILDQKFQAKKCLESERIRLSCSHETSPNICDVGSFTHYIEAKILLGKKDELLKNEKIISIINNTYNNNKAFYANKTILNPSDNVWVHMILAMKLLDLLNQKEKDFWVIKYANSKIDENFPKVPQQWNRIWIFRTFNIYDVYTLAEEYNLNISEIEDNICSYVPPLDDYYKENIFKESNITMLNKYNIIKTFCNSSLND